jgi:hypothetical protein
MIVDERTGYGYDESAWPLLLIVEPRIAPSDAAFRAHLEKVRHYYERGERFGFLVDVRASAPLPADKRRQLAEFVDQNLKTYGPLLVGTALVTSSVLFRGFLKAFLWLRQAQDPPTNIFATFDEAKAWLRGKLRSSRVSPPTTTAL